MKHVLSSLGAVVGLFAVASAAWSQPEPLPEPLVAEDFEHSSDAWLGLGDKAKVSLEHAPENVKAGTGSLRFDYNVAPGQTNILVAPLVPRSLYALQSISFWVKSSHNASLLFALREENGARYSTSFFAPKDQWQRVEIAPKDLVLQVGKDDPKDANGKLDLDKLDGAALLDIDQIFVQGAAGPNNPVVALLGIEAGPRTVYLDDMVLSSKPLPPEKAPSKTVALDEFNRPQASWLSVGDITLKTVPEGETVGETKANALQADYAQQAGRAAVISKLIPLGLLAGKTALSFNVASKRRATLIVQVEETSGGKYNTIIEVPVYAAPDGVAVPQTLAFADFRRADDSKDDNDQLDLEQVKQVTFIDATALLGKGEGPNTLRISQLQVK